MKKPIDIVLSLLPSLTDRDQEKVRLSLQMIAPSPCQKSGHSFKSVKEIPRWFTPPKLVLVCSKCGLTKEI